MRFRPGTPVAENGVQGEGLLVVDPGNGAPARLYGSTDPVSVPTLHAMLEGDRVVVRSTGPVDVRTGRRGRGRAGGVRRRVGLRAEDRAAVGVVLLVPLLRGRHGRRHRGEPRGLRPTRAGRRRGADRRRLEPRTGRGADRRGAVRIAARRGGSDPGLWSAGGAVAGAVPGRGARPRWPASTRLAGRARRAQLGPGPRGPRPDPPRAFATCSPRTCSGWWGWAIDYLKLDFLYAGALDGAGGLPFRARAGPRGRRPRRLPGRLRRARCCPASDWSTPCGSPPTPSTRAARTAPPGCAA